ncbi:AsmA family protein, partial [Nitratidesulfovibrio liaohensis]|uniref:AsmA family protein n=1 Tax=Nitratidesulfovibrio liaohensis TaxID=2604158 RepID=UPI001421EF2D
MRLRPLPIILCLVLLAAVGGYAALRHLIDSDAAARQLGESLTALTGHASRVQGGVRVIFDPDPTVVARDVVMEQASPFAGQEPLLRVAEARFNLRLAPLFFGQVEVRGVEVARPQLVLLADGEGRNGWDGLLERLGGSAAAPSAASSSPLDSSVSSVSSSPSDVSGAPAPPASPVPSDRPGESGPASPAAGEGPRIEPSPPTAAISWFTPQVVLTGAAALRIEDADLQWRNTASGAQLHIRGVDVDLVASKGRLAEAALRHGSLEWRAEPQARPAMVRDFDLSFTTPGGGWKALRDLLQGALDVMPHREGAGQNSPARQERPAEQGPPTGQGSAVGRATGGRAGVLRMSCTYDVAPGVTGTLGLEAAVAHAAPDDAPSGMTALLPAEAHGTARARGHVPLGGKAVPFELVVPFDARRGTDPRITGARLQLEQDALEVTASLRGLGTSDAVVHG